MLSLIYTIKKHFTQIWRERERDHDNYTLKCRELKYAQLRFLLMCQVSATQDDNPHFHETSARSVEFKGAVLQGFFCCFRSILY